MNKHDETLSQMGILDGPLPPDQMDDLKNRLRTDPEAMHAYLDYIELEGLLHAKYSHSASISHPMPRLMDGVVNRQRRRQVKVSLLAAAAVVLALLVATALLRSPESFHAVCQFSADSSFAVTHAEGETGGDRQMLPGSTMRLNNGTAELLLDSGVKSVVEAPAEFTLTEDGHLSFVHGKAWFHVPPAATGFTVTTPRIRVVDLGTEFAISAPKDEPNTLHVFTGKVEFSTIHGNGEKQTVTAGSAYSASAGGKVNSIELDPSLFYHHLPAFTGTLDLDPSTQGSHGLRVETLPRLVTSRDHLAKDNQWGVNWDSVQAVAAARRVWVARQDLGEKAPRLTTTIAGLKPNQSYEISIRHPMHSDSPYGLVRAAIGDAPLKEYNRGNSELIETPEQASEYADYRSILGVTQADGTGTIRVSIAPSRRRDSRSYFSAVGIREIHSE
ncbi:MAG: FecR domain-containing protein [Akkermansiaceae bacterium]|nr:FecR domain-containing protein [Akkermansiaceae bacterium]